MSDRPNPDIGYLDDGETLDELHATGADIHLEMMGAAELWASITIGGRVWHINAGATNPRAHGYAHIEEIL